MSLDDGEPLTQTGCVGTIARVSVGIIAIALSSAAIAADEAPICPDRPSKGTGTCTVPAGHWQLETGLVDWTHDHWSGATSTFTEIGASLIKYGVTPRADIELGIVPFEISGARDGGSSDRESGFGDLLVRTKLRLTGDGGPVQLALDPFVKIPAAKHDLGNGKLEAGLTVPVGVALSGPVSLGFAPELDWRADGDGHGHHAAMAQLIDLGFAASSSLSLTAEVWSQWDWDPVGTATQRSADGAIAYLVSKSLQLDAGANFGLNRQTADVELYAGVSTRF